MSAEVIDLRCLVPLDMETVLMSVQKTGRCVVVSQAVSMGSFTGEVASTIQQQAFDYLDAPVVRVGAKNGIAPQSHVLEGGLLSAGGGHRRGCKVNFVSRGRKCELGAVRRKMDLVWCPILDLTIDGTPSRVSPRLMKTPRRATLSPKGARVVNSTLPSPPWGRGVWE